MKKKLKQYDAEEPVIQEFNEIDLSGAYSYAQYLKWEFDERVELIKGKIFPPAITIEILSPTNQKRDLKLKYSLYEEFGVKEYWIVDPYKYTISKHTLNQHSFYNPPKVYDIDAVFVSGMLPGFSVAVKDIFIKNK